MIIYLLLVGVRHGNALGCAAHVAGGAGVDAAVDLGLLGGLGGGGSVGGGGSGFGGGLGAGEEGESAGHEDGGETHFGGSFFVFVCLYGWLLRY